MELQHGTVQAALKKQPAQRSFVFVTPEAEAIVVGTSLQLVVGAHNTRLEVTEGEVRFRRRHDGAELVVKTGDVAVVAPNVPFATRPLHANLDSETMLLMKRRSERPALPVLATRWEVDRAVGGDTGAAVARVERTIGSGGDSGTTASIVRYSGHDTDVGFVG